MDITIFGWHGCVSTVARVSLLTLCAGLALIFTALVTPFEVGFLESPTSVDGLWIVNRFIDLIFIADMGISFVRAKPNGMIVAGLLRSLQHDFAKSAPRLLSSTTHTLVTVMTSCLICGRESVCVCLA